MIDYLFASYNGGRDAKPLLVGAVSQNKAFNRIDIQLTRLSYRIKDYLRVFIGTPALPRCTVCDLP